MSVTGQKVAGMDRLQEMVQRILEEFPDNLDFADLEKTVRELVETGGERNCINIVKVNGTAEKIDPEDRSVDLDVPRRVTDLEDHLSYTTQVQAGQLMDAKLEGVFRFEQTAAFSDLPQPSKELQGRVWNVTTDFTTDTRFLEGPGHRYPAGTDVVAVAAAEDRYRFDVLPGFIDLEPYTTNEHLAEVLEDTLADYVTGESLTQTLDSFLTEEEAAAGYVAQAEGMGLSHNDFTDDRRDKLDGMEAYNHTPVEAHETGFWKVATDAYGHVKTAEAVGKGDIMALGIPGQDTRYEDATPDMNGLMSAEDKEKLDGMTVAEDSEVAAMLAAVFQ